MFIFYFSVLDSTFGVLMFRIPLLIISIIKTEKLENKKRDSREVRCVIHTQMIESSISCHRGAVCVSINSYLTIWLSIG